MAKPLKDWIKRITDSAAQLQTADITDVRNDNLLTLGPGREFCADKWWNFGDSFYTRWLELSPTAKFVVSGSAVAGTVGLLSLAASQQ